MTRTVVYYVYTESARARENLQHFVLQGMVERESVDYILIINSETCSIPLGDGWSRVIKRENAGYDFGAWRAALAETNPSTYDYLFFLNDTVKGPYYIKNWMSRFTSQLTDETLITGISINCCTYPPIQAYYKIPVIPHVQSMFWCVNRKGFTILQPLLMTPELEDKMQMIAQKEVGMSIAIINAGYNITCLLPLYQHDYRQKERWGEYAALNTAAAGDIWFNGCYCGRTIHPSETIFFKTSRPLNVSG